jgi:Ca-activated chloride channel family protein
MGSRWNVRLLSVLLIVVLLVTACSQSSNNNNSTTSGNGNVTAPKDAVEVSIIYAPESDLYMPEVIQDFNRAYANGTNPLTGQKLAQGEHPIYVTGKSGSSGTVMQGIVNAIIAPQNQNVERPTIFEPSVSHWLALANYQSGRELFDLANSPATANAPVVMAIWESRLNAIKRQYPGEQIGWKQLLDVLHSPNGWADFGFTDGRRTVYYGHTDPYVSSTALSTLIAEYYASALYNANFSGQRLTMNMVNDPAVQQGVRDIESLIRHYSRRTTEFKEYIAQGPDYLDFVALEENDLIYINEGKTDTHPPERLVALYPAEGTFWHEHPFGIVQADWVSEEQAAAARVFADYVRSPLVQEKIMAAGFRPVIPDVELGYPFVPELGVDKDQPATVLFVPDPAVISAIQESWSYVKKQADIWLVMDISGSMQGDKIAQAQQAALAFLDSVELQNRVGLITFNSTINVEVPMDTLEINKGALEETIRSLVAEDNTALYDALIQSVGMFETSGDVSQDRIRAIVLLSDGADTASANQIRDAKDVIEARRGDLNPVIVIPVAYGSDADIQALNSIARSSATKVQSGDPSNISSLLELISSYF